MSESRTDHMTNNVSFTEPQQIATNLLQRAQIIKVFDCIFSKVATVYNLVWDQTDDSKSSFHWDCDIPVLTRMDPDMSLQLTRLIKLLLAYLTFVYFLYSGCSKVIIMLNQMLRQLVLISCYFVTNLQFRKPEYLAQTFKENWCEQYRLILMLG